MGFFSLFELFLVLFTFYAITKYEGTMRVIVPILCLFAVFLFERLQVRIKEDEEAKKRLLKYKLEDLKKEASQTKSSGME
jgi:hypothetical protein